MLKRIFCPGLFPAQIIVDVLTQDVSIYVDSSVQYATDPDDLADSDVLETAVAGCCQKMSDLLDAQSDDVDKSYAEVYRLESAYSAFFSYCAERAFHLYSARKGSICGSSSGVSIARRGGLLGLLNSSVGSIPHPRLAAELLLCLKQGVESKPGVVSNELEQLRLEFSIRLNDSSAVYSDNNGKYIYFCRVVR
jgi:hypothetical protein